MRYYILLALIPLGAYAVAGIVGALGVSAAWPRIRQRVDRRPAGERARVLALLRLLPMLAGTLTALLFATTFVRYEPRGTTETPGVLLLGLAAATLLLCAAALQRIAGWWRAGAACSTLLRQCGQRWQRTDGQRIWVVETSYPVAAVTGFFRTRLLLSARIIRECTPREVEAVIRHEAAHVRRRDNFVRAAMACLPDPLALLAAGGDIQRAWAAAVEEAADDEAAGPQIEGRAELAGALVRVARMAEGPPPAWMPALAFYEGTHLERRVRRLLAAGPGTDRTSRRSLVTAVIALAAGAMLFLEAVSRPLHVLMELAVQHLP